MSVYSNNRIGEDLTYGVYSRAPRLSTSNNMLLALLLPEHRR